MASGVKLVVLSLLLSLASSFPSPYFTIYSGNGDYTIENINDPKGVVTAKYENNITSSGWAYLTLKSNSQYTDYEQMYAAGYLEGALSVDLIYAFYLNIFSCEYSNTPVSANVENWIQNNVNFMNTQIKGNPTDPYWAHIGLVLTQLNGMIDGYNAYANETQKLSFLQFMMINMDGDMSDLQTAMNDTNVDWNDDQSVLERYIFNTHCSVLVKVADDFSELYAGHTTWEGFCEMVRVFKTYDLPISVQQSSSVTMFSGYPGSLSSVDDWYQLDNGLVVTETTNGFMNSSLLAYIVPESVLSFIRVIVTNKIAADGKEWVETFGKYNSGTYNNQWIIVDTNKLNRGNNLEAGALYILEQIPGYVESADVTGILSYGYWPSYNVPYFPYIYNISGFAESAQKYGTMFTYENNPRAEIFRRDAGSVESIEDMQKIMRYNNYQNDVLSHGSAGMAISSRFDLVSANVTNPILAQNCFGGTDSKVTSATMAQGMSCNIQSGPTHDNLPPFEWTDEWASVAHFGQPKVWNFGWVSVQYNGSP